MTDTYNTEALIYLAAALDYDGWISLTKTKKSPTTDRYIVEIGVACCDKEAIDYICSEFNFKSYVTTKEGKKPLYTCKLTNTKAIYLLEHLLPYIRIYRKSYRAKLLILHKNLFSDSSSRRYSTEEISIKHQLHIKIKSAT